MKRFQQAREAPLMIRDTVTHWSGDISSAAPAIVFGARLPLAFWTEARDEQTPRRGDEAKSHDDV
jgi:hypothetical protein